MPRFVKRPVEIDAMFFDGSIGCAKKIVEWCNGQADIIETDEACQLSLRTLEGEMLALEGDVIIIGTKGEVYACKDYVFTEIYQPTTTKEALAMWDLLGGE